MREAGSTTSHCAAPWRDAWLIVVLALGCTRDPAPARAAPDATRAKTAPTAAAAAVDASSSHSSATDASLPRTADAGPRPACVYDLPAPAPRLRAVSSATLAKAIIPSLDPATMKATASPGDGGTPQVTDCRGGRVDAVWEDHSRAPGSVRVELRKALPDDREAIFLATALGIGMGARGGYGLFAIVTLDGPRVAVLGVSAWSPSSDWDGKLRAEKLGGETVYVEPDGFVNEIGGSHQENVWTLRGSELRKAGFYVTLEVHHPYGGDDVADDAGFYVGESFTASPRYTGGKLVLRGESTWNHAVPGEAGRPWAVGRRIPWVRTFELRGDALVETGPKSRWGHSLEEGP